MDIPNNCDCTICRDMCKTPCIPTPRDVQKLIDDDGSGAPIDGELKQTTKRKFKLKM